MATATAARKSGTSKGTTTKGRTRKAAPPAPPVKLPTVLTYYPGKPAVQGRESGDGVRARTAQPAVPPTLEGPDSLIDAFLRERFLWLFDTTEGYGHVTYGALYDTDISVVDTADQAQHRATHAGRGKTRADARRDLVCRFIGLDATLRRVYMKKAPPVPVGRVVPTQAAAAS